MEPGSMCALNAALASTKTQSPSSASLVQQIALTATAHNSVTDAQEI